jgi:hypothetical protein
MVRWFSIKEPEVPIGLVGARMSYDFFECPARFDWPSVEVSLGSPIAVYRDDPRAEGERPCLGRRGSKAESAVRLTRL